MLGAIRSINCKNAEKFLKIINRVTLSSDTVDTLKECLATFIVNNSKQLAEQKFPFREIEPHLLQTIIFRITK
jgi:hypothetical protein